MVLTRIKNLPSTLWTHKKKTIFAALVVAYGADYARKSMRDDKIRKFYCQEALKFGEQPISPDQTPRRLTVLVNTSASQYKVMNRFEKNALPLLHLAGIQVDIMKTESADQLESIAAVLDKKEADGVYLVGGDGSLARVLTGIFKNEDVGKLPIGIFPGGNDNRGLLSLVPNVFAYRDDVRAQCESAMSVIEESTRTIRPFRISSNPDESSEPIYSISDVTAGWYKHIEDYKHKFWYWGRLKRRWAYFWSMIKNSPEPLKLEVYYDEYCPGCKRCKSSNKIPQIELKPAQKQENRSWWSYFFGVPRIRSPKSEEIVPKKDYSKIENEKCGGRHQLQVSGTDLIVDGNQFEDSLQLQFRVGGSEYASRLSFLLDGWKRCKNDLVSTSANLDFYTNDFVASSIELNFQNLPEAIGRIYISGDGKTLEGFEEKVVKIQATEKLLKVYLPSTLRINPDEL